MQALRQYGSSDDDDEDTARRALDRAKDKRAYGAVHTSLGIARTEPLKGDWLGLVYIPIDANSELTALLDEAKLHLQRRQVDCSSTEPNFTEGRSPKNVGLHRIEEPHISLSRPIVLRKHEQEVLYELVQDAIDAFKSSLHSRQAGFTLAFAGFVALPSQDGRSTFIAARMAMGWHQVQMLTTCLDRLLQARLQQRPYFEEACFHASFALFDRHLDNDIAKLAINDIEEAFGDRLRRCSLINVKSICASFGSKKKSFLL